MATKTLKWKLIFLIMYPVISLASPAGNQRDIYGQHKNYEHETVHMSQVSDENSLASFSTALEHLSPHKKCDVCKVFTWISQQAFLFNEDKVASFIDDVCKKFHIVDSDICDGIIKIFKSEVLTVVDELALSPGEVCGFFLGSSCGNFYDPYEMWNITLPPRRKMPPKPPPKNMSSDVQQLRVLQLSDIHIDSQYVIGSNVKCDRPVCCRKESGKVKGESAGRWGSYGSCDSPPWLIEELLKHLSQNEQFDYIMWTGDLTSHADWNQTRENTLYLLNYLTSLFIKYFPNTPVYPAVGNHESIPVNSFPPPYVTGVNSISWLYEEFVQAWSHWLPTSTQKTILRGGYYSVLLHTGYRLVSLNMNYCNNQNWWMLLNTTDPADELQWLVSVLYKAELAREKVHIIGHIAPGLSDCLKAWSWNYYKIIDRFSDTVTSQFFGHTHKDSFEMFYDVATLQRPLSVAYISPSVTTFSNMNPGYRIYLTEGFHSGSHWTVLDHETFILNLTEANTQKHPQWQKEYSAKNAYSLSSLAPMDWHNFTKQLLHDNHTLSMFHRFYTKSSGSATSCDKTCARQYVCSLRSGRSNDPRLCANLTLNWREHQLWQTRNSDC